LAEASRDDRIRYFNSHQVTGIPSGQAAIDGVPASEKQLRSIYLRSGDEEAYRLQNESVAEALRGKIGFAVIVPCFAVLGLAVGGVVGNNQPVDTTATSDFLMSARDQERTAHMWQGAVEGCGLGLIAGALAGAVHYAFCSAASQRDREAAASSFNRFLYQELQFNVSPTPGGAKLGVQHPF
jgi:hypothetical protein